MQIWSNGWRYFSKYEGRTLVRSFVTKAHTNNLVRVQMLNHSYSSSPFCCNVLLQNKSMKKKWKLELDGAQKYKNHYELGPNVKENVDVGEEDEVVEWKYGEETSAFYKLNNLELVLRYSLKSHLKGIVCGHKMCKKFGSLNLFGNQLFTMIVAFCSTKYTVQLRMIKVNESADKETYIPVHDQW